MSLYNSLITVHVTICLTVDSCSCIHRCLVFSCLPIWMTLLEVVLCLSGCAFSQDTFLSFMILLVLLLLILNCVQHALRVGRSYLPLAKTALSALEHWHQALPSAALLTYYPDILPLLDAYLKSTANPGKLVLLSFCIIFLLNSDFFSDLTLSDWHH